MWDREELALIIKYEQFKRNKAAISLMWDLDARNHEVTLLKIKADLRITLLVKPINRATAGDSPYKFNCKSLICGNLLFTFFFRFDI